MKGVIHPLQTTPAHTGAPPVRGRGQAVLDPVRGAMRTPFVKERKETSMHTAAMMRIRC